MFSSIAAVKANRNDSLIAFGEAVLLAADTGNLDAFLAAVKAADKPAPARKARKAKQEAAPTMRTLADGRTMAADAGTATKGQIARLAALGIDAATMSMADAAERYAAAKQPVTHTVTVKEARKAMKESKKAARKARQQDNAIDWTTDNTDDSGYAADDATSRWIERIENSFA